MLIKNTFLFILGLILLIIGANKFVYHLKLLAKKLNISEFIIGLILASFATTLPEISVSIISSLQGNSTIALGNALGSVLVNIAFIFGISSIIIPIKLDNNTWKYSLFLFIITIFLYLLMLDKIISRLEGLILLLIYLFFLMYNYKIRNYLLINDNSYIKNSIIRDLIIIFITAFIIIFGSRLLVDNAVYFAEKFNIPKILIGLTLVAIGTSLPEFANSITSIIKKTPSIGAGNILGANFLNVLIVIGIASIINPINVDQKFIKFTMPLILLVILILTISLKKDNIIGRKTGLILLFSYFLFLIFNFLVI